MHQIWLGVRSGLAVGLVAVLPLAVALVVLTALRQRLPATWRRRARTAVEVGAVVGALGVVAAVTLAPSGYDVRSVSPVPFRDVVVALRDGDATRSLVNCAGNAALFVPLGVALALARRSFAVALLSVTAVSLLVETIQYVARLGRVSDSTDVLTNVAGAAAGWFVWVVVRDRRPRAELVTPLR